MGVAFVFCKGLVVGIIVGLFVVGLDVGKSVGKLVGNGDGGEEGFVVGFGEYLIVGKCVGITVGLNVGISVGGMVGKGDGGDLSKTMHDSSAKLKTPRHSPSLTLFSNPSLYILVPLPGLKTMS